MTYSKLRWRDLTQDEWFQLPKDRTTVILTLGPMEPHGPHLPLGTDLLLAEHLSLHLVSRMTQEDPLRTFLWDDTLALGIDPFHGNGVLESRPSLVKKILEHRVAQIARHGFSEIWVMNMHGSPRHLVVIDEVCEKARWKHRTTGVYSITAQLMSAFLDKELQSKFKLYLQSKNPSLYSSLESSIPKDIHGGWIETSLLLHWAPETVRANYEGLKPANIKSIYSITKTTPQKVPPGLGYLGAPGLASPLLGEYLSEFMVSFLAQEVAEFRSGSKSRKKRVTRYYYIPIFRTHFASLILGFLLLILASLALRSWMEMIIHV